MTYHLKKEVEQEELIEDWMPFEEMEYEDMTYRQNQLEIRIQECRRALDLLHLLNDGKQIDNVLLTTNDLIQFKVSILIIRKQDSKAYEFIISFYHYSNMVKQQ